jgi:uncharacterized protein DUF4388
LVTSEVTTGAQEDWNDARKSALVAQIVNAKLSIKDACERHGLSSERVQEWLRVFRRSALLAFDEQLTQALINQGANAGDLSVAHFAGTLDDISIADLIQTIQMAGKDAVITVSNEEGDSRIWCAGGAITDAESGRLTAANAVYRILNFEHGQVVADLRSAPRVRAVQASTHGLLLEAARRKDESVALRARLGDARRIYQLGERATTTRVSVSPPELVLLRLFDGQRSLGEVLAESDLGDLETLTTLIQLVEGGYLVEAGLSTTSWRHPGQSEAALTRSSMATFLPHASTERPEPSVRGRWVWSVVAAGLLVSGAAWSWTRAATYMAAPSPAGAARGLAVAPETRPAMAQSYVVATRANPSHAEMWLDGRKLTSGHVNTVLAKDGRAHELRVAAEGYAPTTVLFVDAAPPGLVQLEGLPVRPTAAPVVELRAAEPSWRRATPAPRSSGASGAKRRGAPEQAPQPSPSSGVLELTPEFPAPAAPMRKRPEPRLEILELR